MSKRTKSQYLRELPDQAKVDSPFLVKYSSVAVGKTGKPYMNLVLQDKSGELEARIWEGVAQYSGQVTQDAFIWVTGKCQMFQGRRQIVIHEAQVLREDEIDPADYVAVGTLDPEALYAQLIGYVQSMKDPHYRALAEVILIEDEEIVSRFKRAPAAKSVHHAYKTGLLEHVISITATLDFMAGHYGKILDRDLLFLGGFFHDIGKLWELSYDRVTEYTTEGKLIGHLVMGVELMSDKIRMLEATPGRLPGDGKFPEEKKLLVKHVILAHHGQLEYGSPKRPKCLEAVIVHYIDDLDSKVNAIRGFIEQDANPGRWTALNKMYGRYFFKPDWAQPESESAGPAEI